VKVLLHGCNGKMGQVMTQVISETPDMEVVAGVDVAPDKFRNEYPVYKSLDEVKEEVDILIDFSFHTAIDSVLGYGISRNVPLLICTTGFLPEEKAKMREASKKIAVLNSVNMSLGVNILVSIVKQIAALASDVFDIEVVEKHHNQKVDSPSGTALMLADAMNEVLGKSMEYTYGRHSKKKKRKRKEIGIHAIRGGAIVGEHVVIFAGQGEVIEIKHSAMSRNLFAYGAVKAAKFIVGKGPGFYTMADVIEGDA
jgi:4-hydroxy-tetrahydrodipicolinate reductase